MQFMNRGVAMNVAVKLTFDNDYSIQFFTQDILEYKVGNTIATDNTTPNWGVIGQYANLTVKDRDNFIKYLKNNRNIGFSCDFYLNNNSLGIKFYMDNVSVNDEAHTVAISLVDGTSRLKNIPKNKRALLQKSLSALVSDTITYDINNNDFVSQINYADSDTQYMFENSVAYDFSSATNVYDFLNDICQLTHTCMYIRDRKLEVVPYE